MKKKRYLFLCLVALCGVLPAQQTHESSGTQRVRLTPYGFVRNYFTFDNRAMYSVVGGEYDMLPYDADWNVSESDAATLGIARADMNAVADARFLAITTRVGVNMEGPTLFGARSGGKVEADFGGFGTTNSVLRIRHAYMSLTWNRDNGGHSTLIAGQTWHPLSGSYMPEVLGMAAGAPFRAHSRTPQVQYLYAMPSGVELMAAALYQLQYMYNGPQWSSGRWVSTASTDFANHAVVPELFFGVQYRRSQLYAQVGADVQTLRPRTYTMLQTSRGVWNRGPVSERFTTVTPTLYVQYALSKWSFKFRYIYAGNTSHVNQLNGYAVTDVAADGTWSYAPMRAHISYLNVAYGKQVRANLFVGYMKNMGAGSDLYNFATATATSPSYAIFIKGGDNFTHLNSLFRVAPGISYNTPAFNVGIEYELTGASYGTWDSNGSIRNDDDLHGVLNHRICMMIKYNF